MTPMTQMLAAMALSIVITVALVQSAHTTRPRWGLRGLCHRHADDRGAHSPAVRGLWPHHARAGGLERGLELIHDVPSETQGHYAEPARARRDRVP